MKIFKKVLKIVGIFFSVLILAFGVYAFSYSMVHELPNEFANSTELNKNISLKHDFYLDDSSRTSYANAIASVKIVSKYDVWVEGTLDNNGYDSHYKYVKHSSNSKATVVLSHGYTECFDKYDEVFYYFYSAGYNVYMMEHRGHGLNDRLLDDPYLVYVDSFSSYVNDLKSFINNVVKVTTESDDKIVLWAHSMGGGIATKCVQENPNLVDVLVLSAPMIKPVLAGLPEFLSNFIVSGACLFGKSKDYVIGGGPYDPNYQYTIDGSDTSCDARAYYTYSCYSHEYNRLWGASYNWVKEAINATHEMQKVENIQKMKLPVLLFQAGKDTYVDPKGQNQLAKYLPNGTCIKVSDAKHGIWQEKNEILIPYFETIFNFIEAKIA